MKLKELLPLVDASSSVYVNKQHKGSIKQIVSWNDGAYNLIVNLLVVEVKVDDVYPDEIAIYCINLERYQT